MAHMANDDLEIADVPFTHDPWAASRERYAAMPYRRVGTSGLLLPAISLGLWYNFGDNRPFDIQREVLRHAFDRGITHFDLANNYGPPYGSAEENFGRDVAQDFTPYATSSSSRPRPATTCGQARTATGSSRKYILASAREVAHRDGLDYVDIFYSHRVDPVTPIEETVGALDTPVRQGKALYVGSPRTAPSARRSRRGSPASRHSTGDPPAVVLDPQPLGRSRTHRRALARGHGCDRVHPARSGAIDRPVPRATAARHRPRHFTSHLFRSGC